MGIPIGSIGTRMGSDARSEEGGMRKKMFA